MLWVSLCFGFMPTHGLSNLLFLKHFNAVLIQTLFSRLVINECTRLVSLDIAWCKSIVHWFLCQSGLSEPADTKESLGSDFLFSLLDCQSNVTASFLQCCFILLSPLPFFCILPPNLLMTDSVVPSGPGGVWRLWLAAARLDPDSLRVPSVLRGADAGLERTAWPRGQDYSCRLAGPGT